VVQLTDQRPVKLDQVHRRSKRIAQTRNLCSEVVDCQPHPKCPQGRDGTIGGFGGIDQPLLGDLQDQPLRRKAGRAQNPRHLPDRFGIADLDRRDVDVQVQPGGGGELGVPGHHLAARVLDSILTPMFG